MELEGKHKIELNYPGDGRVFLNYWDWAHGRDVCCQIIDGKLMKSNYDNEGNELPVTEISFSDFIKLVEESISKIAV